MNLHEYQAKSLFSDYQIPIPQGVMISSMAQLDAALTEVDGDQWVVKAQIHAGARGKAGGVKLVASREEAHQVAEQLLGSSLATIQTAGKALPIHSLLIEQTLNIQTELYLSLLVDRVSKTHTFIISEAGGMDIEAVAEATPEKILTVHIDPTVGLMPYQCREVGFALGLQGTAFKQLMGVMQGLYRLALDKDIALLEINPLVVTSENNLIALDAKINIDSNALYRQPALVAMRDATQEDEREAKAADHQLNYIALEGDIGCMVNGAGLAMATMDLIKLNGGEPANFLDVGGGATPERVSEAFKLILSSPDVKSILVNIFGGIVRCDLIADGIIQAVQEVGLTIPVVVRLEGTNVELGKEKLAKSGLSIITADGLADAAQKVVAAAKDGGAI
ncbi:ADP-forming succinate--CoA ligase subunit beta [Hydrogenovibrio marinus]|uniref:Succinate--CoA ligase [ADP-forming] subunit beta n=1 Tax=Hydrogenovibrio marinus TaxID=28885 RepID=A0A066ZN06_HYDMR|nr:ADP-forming succinate--CoA ligase subunit beta [Hydrogenovibrio marinus]KDN94912.1 succinyl-CoA synthetase subunit beta [Hydrogenovibrio marinus]BBN59376.1 succinate--CoA ligase [ADP-forming] subunit beta [Hydrogenovibrio marinus]